MKGFNWKWQKYLELVVPSLSPNSGVSPVEVFFHCQQPKDGRRQPKSFTFHVLWSFLCLGVMSWTFTEGWDQSMVKFQRIDKVPEMYTRFVPMYLFLIFLSFSFIPVFLIYPWCVFWVFVLFCFVFLGLHQQHTEVLRLGVKSELQQQAYTTATATRDLSGVCNLHHSSWQHRILNPLIEAREQTQVIMDASRVR